MKKSNPVMDGFVKAAVLKEARASVALDGETFCMDDKEIPIKLVERLIRETEDSIRFDESNPFNRTEDASRLAYAIKKDKLQDLQSIRTSLLEASKRFNELASDNNTWAAIGCCEDIAKQLKDDMFMGKETKP